MTGDGTDQTDPTDATRGTGTGDATLDRALGRAWRDDLSWALLTRLTEIENRMGGHPGERRAAERVADALSRVGADPGIEAFPMQRWTRGRTELTVHVPANGANGAGDPGGTGDAADGSGPTDPLRREEPIERAFEAVALPYSPAADVRAKLVDVGHGTPDEIEAADVSGAVVLARADSPPGERHVHRMEKAGHAAAAGARAFVLANHVPGQLPPTGALAFDTEAAIPGVGVSKETGAWLVEYADAGSRAEAGSDEWKGGGDRPDARVGDGGIDDGGGEDGGTGGAGGAEACLHVEATTEAGESRNVVGTVGPDTDEEVVVVAHHDAHDVGEGALDNGCGAAVLVGAARILAALDAADGLGCRVRVASVGCEELGLMGAAALADALDLGCVKGIVNVDGAGRFRDLRALTHGSDRLAGLVEGVADRAGQPVDVRGRPHPYSDHWPFLRAGVPALQLHSRDPDASGAWDRGWTHTRADTRDKADPRTLREHAMLTALVVRELAASERLGRIDPEDLRERLREAGAEPGMRAAGIWPGEW
jgi:Zn-dependent M28 family amino/carboxypeptidase